jgi:O-antigen/teichoic acid export membrane protein
MLERALPKAGFARNVAALAGGTLAGQVLLVASSPLLTRLYTPADFGAFGLYASALSVLMVATALRYDLAIPVAADDRKATSLFVLSIALVLLTTFMGLAAILLLRNLLPASLRSTNVSEYAWLVGVGLVFAGVYQAIYSWAIRTRSFKALAEARVFQNGGQAVGQALLAVPGLGAVGLMLGDVFGRLLGVVRLGSKSLPRIAPEHRSWSALREVAIEYARFPKVMLLAGLLNAAAVQAPFLLFPASFGADSAGMYFLAHRVLIIPASLIGTAVGQAFFGEAAGLRENPARLHILTKRLTVVLLAVVTPVYGAVAVIGPLLFTLAFGPKWVTAGEFAQVLAPMILIWSVARPLSSLLVVGDRLGESLLYTALELGLKAAAVAIGAAVASVDLAVWLLSLFGIGLSLLAVRRFVRVANVNIGDLIGPLGPIVSVNVAALVCLKLCAMTGSITLVLSTLLVLAPIGCVVTLRLLRSGLYS